MKLAALAAVIFVLGASVAYGLSVTNVTANGVHYKYPVVSSIASSFKRSYRIVHPTASCVFALGQRLFICSLSRSSGAVLTRPYWRQYYVYVIKNLKVVRVYRYRIV